MIVFLARLTFCGVGTVPLGLVEDGAVQLLDLSKNFLADWPDQREIQALPLRQLRGIHQQ